MVLSPADVERRAVVLAVARATFFGVADVSRLSQSNVAATSSGTALMTNCA